MKRLASAVVLALGVGFLATGCTPSTDQVRCETYGGSYNAGRVPACLGQDYTPSVEMMRQCIARMQVIFGMTYAVADAYC